MRTYLIQKIGRSVELSYDIPETEKKIAKSAIQYLKALLVSMEMAKKHLNELYQALESGRQLSPEDADDNRGVFFRYSNKIEENFNKVKQLAFKTILKLNCFETDTEIAQLINAFNDGVEDVEAQVKILFRILKDLKSAKLIDNLKIGIENVRKACFDLEKLVEERIIDHINANILVNDWKSTIQDKDELENEISKNEPHVTRLLKERQEALDKNR